MGYEPDTDDARRIVDGLARMRAENTARSMTIPEAIEKARSLREQPERLIDDATAKRTIFALLAALESKA